MFSNCKYEYNIVSWSNEILIILVRRDSGRGLTFASPPYRRFLLTISESISRLHNSAIRWPSAIIIKRSFPSLEVSARCERWKKNIRISYCKISYIFILYYTILKVTFSCLKEEIFLSKSITHGFFSQSEAEPIFNTYARKEGKRTKGEM